MFNSFFVVLDQGGKAAIRNLNSKIAVLDTDSLKQQEIIYNEDYTVFM